MLKVDLNKPIKYCFDATAAKLKRIPRSKKNSDHFKTLYHINVCKCAFIHCIPMSLARPLIMHSLSYAVGLFVQAAPRMRPHVVYVATFIRVISFIRNFSWLVNFLFFALIQKTSQPLCLFVRCITTKPSSSPFISTVPALKRPFLCCIQQTNPAFAEEKKRKSFEFYACLKWSF